MGINIVPGHITKLNFSIKTAILLFGIILLSFTKLHAQQFYAATDQGILEQVTITSKGLVSRNVNGCGTGYFSIALWGSKIYYTDDHGVLFVADISKGNSPKVTNCNYVASLPAANSMTVDKNGILYLADSRSLYKLDPTDGQLVNVGVMPYGASGDLVFFDD